MRQSILFLTLFIVSSNFIYAFFDEDYLFFPTTINTTINNITSVSYGSGGGWTNTSTTTSTSLDVNVDSGTLFVNSSSNRVGIGTTSPYHNLSISGSVGFYDPSMTTTGDYGYFYTSNGGTWATRKLILNTLVQGVATDTMTWNDGKVGIGTASPEELLTLALASDGTSTNRKTIKFNNGGWAAPGAGTTNSNGDKLIFYEGAGEAYKMGLESYYLWLQTERGLKIYDTDATLFSQISTISSQDTFFNGRYVGIGTNAPRMKLDVNTSTGIVLDRYGSSFGVSINLYKAGQPKWVIHGDVSGNNNNTFSIRDNSSNDRLSINYLTGNVGIGTITPTSKLHVVGNVNITGTVYYGALVANSPHAFMADESSHTEICMIAEDGVVVLHTIINDKGVYRDSYIPNSPVCLNKKVLNQVYDIDEGTQIKTVSEYQYLFGTKEKYTTETFRDKPIPEVIEKPPIEVAIE